VFADPLAERADYIMSLTYFLLVRTGRLFALPIHRRIAAFERDCLDPQRVQTDLLRRILARQAVTAFGRDHRFADVRTVADYRRHVPVAPYEYVEPYIERVKQGETDALIAGDRVLMFALTSGTTAARKLIPITDRYLADYRRGWNMWGARAYKDHRDRWLFLRAIVQMVGDPEEFRTAAGTPCGNLSGFTAEVQKRFIRWLYAIPAVTGKIKDARSRYYVALRLALPRSCALFIAANPSTLVMLGRVLDQEKEKLLRDVHDGALSADLDLPPAVRAFVQARLKKRPERARELDAIAGKADQLYPKDVWRPETTLIGTWTGGSMGPYLRQLPRYFGEPPVRDLGLLASEGRMTIPFANDTPAGALDIWSHYFEFISEGEADSKSPTVLGAHELEDGKSYFIVPTTASGLYRYQISDLVRVRGFLGRTPLVEFLGKGHRFANLTGEKLSEHQVTQAMETTARRTGFHVNGYSLAPVWDDARPYYGLFIEESDAADGDALKRFLAEYDKALGELNIEYAAKRESARLGPVRAFVIPSGTWARWDRDRLATTGGSAEQYKHPCLIGDLGFKETMSVMKEIAPQ
ncbi:MAG TPA: GH3 auxin-responsive promoter family protein, partial [Fimbriiglobus sp.]|nr:GH3 auxin-responsive promoter family protein [Fimbriiglobus sp.]